MRYNPRMKNVSSIVSRLLLAGVFAASLGAPALADIPAALKNAEIKTQSLHSYHITMVSPNSTVQGDVINPGRYHMRMPEGEAIIIGDTMYMRMSVNGPWQKSTGMGTAFSQQDVLHSFAAEHEVTVSDLGDRAVGGTHMHAYLVTNTAKHMTSTVFVDGQGRIARMEVGNMVMTLSRFGEAVSISAPM